MIKFWEKREEEEEDITDEEIEEAYDLPKSTVTFSIEQDNTININLDWDSNPDTGKLLGDLLFQINTGKLAQEINKILMEKHADPEYTQFITNVMESWKNNAASLKADKSPFVHPLKTFGASRIQ